MESHGGFIDGCGRINVQNIHIEHGTTNSVFAPGLFQCADLCYQGNEPNFYIDGVLYKDYHHAFTNGDPLHAYFSADSIFICGLNYNGGAIGSVLPIELTTFGAHQTSHEIYLFWTTATEQNNDYFTVENSVDGTNWQLLKTINGAGNSTASMHYSIEDINPYIGWNYYRLKQTDFDGTEKTSREISIYFNPTKGEKISLFPNPSSDFIEIFGTIDEHKNFKITDINGKNLTEKVKIIHQGKSKLHIDISELKIGIYFVSTQTELIKFLKI